MIRAGIPTHSDVPASMMVDANQANQMKRVLQNASQFRPGTVLDPVTEAKNAALAAKAAGLRQSIEGVDPGVKSLNQQMQEGITLQDALRQGGKTRPLAYVSSESPDNLAQLARVEKNGAGGLLDFGNQYGAAKMTAMKDIDDSVSRAAQKTAGRFLLRQQGNLGELNPGLPTSLQTILNLAPKR